MSSDYVPSQYGWEHPPINKAQTARVTKCTDDPNSWCAYDESGREVSHGATRELCAMYAMWWNYYPELTVPPSDAQPLAMVAGPKREKLDFNGLTYKERYVIGSFYLNERVTARYREGGVIPARAFARMLKENYRDLSVGNIERLTEYLYLETVWAPPRIRDAISKKQHGEDKTYTVSTFHATLESDGRVQCDCPSFKYGYADGRGFCEHIIAAVEKAVSGDDVLTWAIDLPRRVQDKLKDLLKNGEKVFRVKSFSGGHETYNVTLSPDGTAFCTCPAFKYGGTGSHGECKHIASILSSFGISGSFGYKHSLEAKQTDLWAGDHVKIISTGARGTVIDIGIDDKILVSTAKGEIRVDAYDVERV